MTTAPKGDFPAVSALLVQSNGQILVAGPAGSGLRKFRLPRFWFGTVPTVVWMRHLARRNCGGTHSYIGPHSTGAVLRRFLFGRRRRGLRRVQLDGIAAIDRDARNNSGVQPVVTGLRSDFCQPNGDFVEAAIVGNGFQKTAGELFRFSETSVLDSTFSSKKFTFGGQKQNQPAAIALESNWQIVVGGGDGLARFDSNGVADTAFSTGGSLPQLLASPEC